MSAHEPLESDAVLWSAGAADRAGRPLLILLHGYGSDERDLFGLVPHLPEEFVIAAVRAPLAPPFPTPGYSWYAIDGLDSRDPVHVTASAHQLLAWRAMNVAEELHQRAHPAVRRLRGRDRPAASSASEEGVRGQRTEETVERRRAKGQSCLRPEGACFLSPGHRLGTQ